jgi:methyl-accepting chemotaxis protein
MTRQNAEHATQANHLMTDTSQVVSTVNASMEQLSASMIEISKASEETSKIIKTIDEIAFQTNLLALNAAVEAARAGEAGAGFAVVADEVRNLAMKAADAAKNTANLIEGTVKKVKEGSEIVEKTSVEFSNLSGSAEKIGELVSEMAAASPTCFVKATESSADLGLKSPQLIKVFVK